MTKETTIYDHLTFTSDDYILRISRGVVDRLEREALAAIAYSLGTDGLKEAIDYLVERLAARGRPSALDLVPSGRSFSD